jgi:hypothetical protein
VTIEPSGRWSYSGAQNGNSATNGIKHEYDEDDSDDLVEVTEVSRPSIKNETPTIPFSFNLAPQVPSPGSAASAPRAGQKRKSEVIDLTLSDDDEPLAKRPAYDTPNSLPDQRNGYPSFKTSSSHTLSANGNSSFQLERSVSGLNNSYHSSPAATHHPTMAGSPLAPITISSPPTRLSPAQPNDYLGNPFNFQQRHQPSHHPPPPPHQGSNSSNSNPLQRATLLGLAGRRPYDS